MRTLIPVGVSWLAMGVNDDAFYLLANVNLECIASKLAPTEEGGLIFKYQKRKNPLSRVFVKSKAVTLNLNWCPEEDSNFHDLAVTST